MAQHGGQDCPLLEAACTRTRCLHPHQLHMPNMKSLQAHRAEQVAARAKLRADDCGGMMCCLGQDIVDGCSYEHGCTSNQTAVKWAAMGSRHCRTEGTGRVSRLQRANADSLRAAGVPMASNLSSHLSRKPSRSCSPVVEARPVPK